MAGLDLDYLNHVDAARSAEEALFGASDIGGLPVVDRTSAMLVELRGGHWVFSEEVPIQVATRRRGYERENGKGSLRWNRWEVKVERTEARLSAYLTLTEFPWASRWASAVPFRRSTKGRVGEVILPATSNSASDAEIIAAIDALGRDPFESSKHLLTAARSIPEAPRGEDRARSYAARARHVFGLVLQDPVEVRSAVLESSHVQDLLQKTRANTIHFANTQAIARTGKLVKTPRLSPEVIEACDELMVLSVDQALAGPPDNESYLSETWIERPVTDLVEYIYKSQLNNPNRKLRRTQKRTMASADWFWEKLTS